MGRYRVYTIEFKKQVVQEYLGGESLHALGKRHQISRNLIRIWIAKYEAGEFNDDQAAADMLAEYEARIALLERKVGQLTLENDLLKKTLPPPQLRTGDSGSVISGPMVSALRKGARSSTWHEAATTTSHWGATEQMKWNSLNISRRSAPGGQDTVTGVSQGSWPERESASTTRGWRILCVSMACRRDSRARSSQRVTGRLQRRFRTLPRTVLRTAVISCGWRN